MRHRGVLLDRRMDSRKVSEWESLPSNPEQIKAMESYAEHGFSVRDALSYSEWGPFVGGGAVETGQVVLQNVPVAPYVIDAPSFFAATEPNFFQAAASPAFTPGAPLTPIIMPAVGVYAKLIIQFSGSVTQATASGTTTAAWPYDMLSLVQFTANGQDDLFSSSGMALKALEATRYPYMVSSSATPTAAQSGAGITEGDVTGPGIGGGLTISVGTTNLLLTWEIPLNMDEASLVGGVFAQARTLNILVRGFQAAVAHLITNSTGTSTFAGNFSIGLKTYSVPVSGNGNQAHLIIPDLRFLHGFNQIPQPVPGFGDQRTTMTRVDGSLFRIFVHDLQTNTDPIAFYVPYGAPNAPATASAAISQYRLEFGGNKRPWVFNPAQFLTRLNSLDYGAPLPYHMSCLDLARYNAVRDGINLAGVTELYWVSTIAAAVAAPVNGLQVVVGETLFR